MELHAKKSLGQHFLNSPVVLKQIIESAHIHTEETVLEIGPGTGVLTKALIETGANVIAIEKDRRAIELLKERFSKEIADGRLKLVEADILDRQIYNFQFPISNTLGDGLIPNSKFEIQNSLYALVANIPYYITGAILELFLEHEPRPNRMILLVQREVAERIIAVRTQRSDLGVTQTEVRPLSGKESILSISVKAFGTPKIIACVPRGAFTPPPTVDSAVLSIENISDKRFKENGLEITRFFEILKAGFAHKRKLLIRNLETIVGNGTAVKETADGMTAKDKLKKAWLELGLNEKARAEEITLEKWLGLASRFQ